MLSCVNLSRSLARGHAELFQAACTFWETCFACPRAVVHFVTLQFE